MENRSHAKLLESARQLQPPLYRPACAPAPAPQQWLPQPVRGELPATQVPSGCAAARTSRRESGASQEAAKQKYRHKKLARHTWWVGEFEQGLERGHCRQVAPKARRWRRNWKMVSFCFNATKRLACFRVIPIIESCCSAANRTKTTASRQRGVREQFSTTPYLLILE